MRIYLDTCSLSRPFDNQSQARIRMETESITHILQAVSDGLLTWVSSEVILYEISKCSDPLKRSGCRALHQRVSEIIRISGKIKERAIEIESYGIRKFDALHLACAEEGNSKVLLTTDDRFEKAANRTADANRIKVMSPLGYRMETMQ